MFKKLLKLTVLIFILICAGLILYGWYLSVKVEKRFAGRRWSIPSTVFSDITILYPGQRINRSLLIKSSTALDTGKFLIIPGKRGRRKLHPLK